VLDTDLDELEQLRRANRDLATCLSLPALWAGRDARYIVRTLVDVLVTMLEPDLAYAATRDRDGRVILEDWKPRTAARPAAIAEAVERSVGDMGFAVQTVQVPGVAGLRLARASLSMSSGGGVVAVAAARENFPTEWDATLVRVAANQAGIALNTAEMVAREEQLRSREQAAVGMLQQLQVVTEMALSGRTASEVLRDLLRRIRSALGTDTATVLLLDPDGACLRPVASDGLSEAPGEAAGVPLGGGVAGLIASRDEAMIVEDPEAGEVVRPIRGAQRSTLMGAPLKVDGRLIGVIHVGSVGPRTFTADDLRLLRLVADRAALVIDHARRDEAERAARAEIEGAEGQLRLALAAGRMGTWEWTIGTGAVRWSPGLEVIHGLRPGTFPGTFEAFQKDMHPEDRDRVVRALAAALEQRRAHHVEYRIVRPDGDVRWVEGRGQLFLDVSGQPDRMVGVCADVTERKQAEEQRARLLALEQAARSEAESANRAKDEFLAVLSHELRAPLTTILGWVRMLLAGQVDPSRQARALQVIERSTLAQARMIEDLLDMSRIVAGKMALDRRVVSLAPLVAETVSALQHEAKAKGLTLEADLDPIAGAVLADADRLRQVLMNLLGNAMKFTPSGGRVAVRFVGDGDLVRLVVRDTGVGIDAELLPHVFERFRQADWRQAGTRVGLGLGLAIVRQLVELHGGTVEAQSDGPGRGACFTVTLPLAR
jgi:PAS domain S-box-containing protein